jgi:hypothetical protein
MNVQKAPVMGGKPEDVDRETRKLLVVTPKRTWQLTANTVDLRDVWLAVFTSIIAEDASVAAMQAAERRNRTANATTTAQQSRANAARGVTPPAGRGGGVRKGPGRGVGAGSAVPAKAADGVRRSSTGQANGNTRAASGTSNVSQEKRTSAPTSKSSALPPNDDSTNPFL